MENKCKSKGLGVALKYVRPRAPHRNGKVVRKFQTLYVRIRAMLDGAGLQDDS